MHKLHSFLFETRAGRLALLVWVLFMLAGLIVLADVMPTESIAQVLASAVLVGSMASLKAISKHRGKIAARTHDQLPVALGAAGLFFPLLILPVRFFAAPARVRPRPAAGRLGRLPAVTLSPRLLPIPTFARV